MRSPNALLRLCILLVFVKCECAATWIWPLAKPGHRRPGASRAVCKGCPHPESPGEPAIRATVHIPIQTKICVHPFVNIEKLHIKWYVCCSSFANHRGWVGAEEKYLQAPLCCRSTWVSTPSDQNYSVFSEYGVVNLDLRDLGSEGDVRFIVMQALCDIW